MTQYTARIAALQALLPTLGVDALYVSHPKNILYLTGQELSLGRLIVGKQTVTLLVDGRYIVACKEALGAIVEPYSKEKLIDLFKTQYSGKIGFEASEERYWNYMQLKELTDAAGCELTPLQKPVVALRAVKDMHEIEKIQAACNLCVDGFDFVVASLKEGITEKQLATELDIFWKKRGGECGFPSIIAFGENTSKPHYRPKERALAKNEVVLVDIGCCLNGYHSDMTRMVFFGQVHPKIEEICTIVKNAQETALAACRAGATSWQLDTAARDVITQAGFGDHFPHSTGHGVGLDIHEDPIIKKDDAIPEVVLKPGMIITIEPGIYLPGIGGVRIEDTVVVQEGGYIQLINRPHEALRKVMEHASC